MTPSIAPHAQPNHLAHYCLSDAYGGKEMYSLSIKEWKVESQLSGEPNDSELASAVDEGFRAAGFPYQTQNVLAIKG
jgi:hypothetical protein